MLQSYRDFFLPKMVENLDEWINSKKYTMQDITDMIGSKKISSVCDTPSLHCTLLIMQILFEVLLELPTLLNCVHESYNEAISFSNSLRLKDSSFFPLLTSSKASIVSSLGS